MAEFGSLAEFAAFAAIGGAMHRTVEAGERVAIEAMAALICDEAKRVLGSYDYGWQQLAPSTQADRVQHGFPANEPLLRSGELRDSIDYTVISNHEAEVGSNLDVAVFQELGTIHIPPRSFLAAAAAHEGNDAAKVAGKIIAEAIRHAGQLLHVETEIWRLAIDIARELSKTLHDIHDDMSTPERHQR